MELYSDYESDLELDTIIDRTFDENNNNNNNKRKNIGRNSSESKRMSNYLHQQQLPRRPSSVQSTSSTKTSLSSLSSTTQFSKKTLRSSESPSLGRRRTPTTTINLRSQCSGDCCMGGLPTEKHSHRHTTRRVTRSESKSRTIENNNKNFVKNSKKILQNLSPLTETAIETSSQTSSARQKISVNQVEDYNHNICLKSNNNNNNNNNINISTKNSEEINSNQYFAIKQDWSSSVHQRYLEYLNYSQEERDLSKTDYTYAHSFSYSPLISRKDRFSWTIPNMSRPSIGYHNRSLLDKASVQRQMVNDIPVSQIDLTNTYNTRRTSPKNVRSTKALMKEAVIHSTPKVKNTKTNLSKGSRKEFSDDDDDYDDEMEEEIHSGIQPNHSTVNNYRTNFTRNAISKNAKLKNSFDDAELSEDEEEINIIRRINRVVIKTVRNIFTGSSTNSQENMQTSLTRNNLNNDVVVDDDKQHYPNNSHLLASSKSTIYQTNHQTNTRLNQSNNNGGNRYNSLYGRTPINANNRNNRNKMPYRNLFLILFLFTALSSSCLYYYFYGNNLKFANLLEDFSQSSSGFKFFNYGHLFGNTGDSSPLLTGLNSGEDISRINNEIQSLRNEVLSIKRKYDDSLDKLKSSSVGEENNVVDSDPKMPNFDQVLERLATLEAKLVNCCRSPAVNQTIEDEIKHIVESKLYAAKEQRDKHLQNEVNKIKEYLVMFVQDQTKNLTSIATAIVANSTLNAKSEGEGSDVDSKITDSAIDTGYIEKMIKNAIAKYDADKTGEADFALESAGAWIVSTRCSETFELYSASYKLLGLTLWRSSNTPRILIQSGVIPGECWCFKTGEGRVAIHLSTRIIPTAFTYEHIPKELSRDGNINSAPAKFAVYGLKSEDDIEPELLGEYQYLLNGESMQRFVVQNVQTALHTFRNIELVVKSNHGHPEYTCLYRFRVHDEKNASLQPIRDQIHPSI